VTRSDIFRDISLERANQDEIHPDTEKLPYGTGFDGFKLLLQERRESVAMAKASGHDSWALHFREECYEVLAEADPAKLRAELIQVAALCVRWVEHIDSQGA